MTDGQVSLAARAAHGERRRPAVRRAAQPERRELGDGDPGPQGRRAVDPGRHEGPAGRGDPRPRPGHRLRAQGAVRDKGEVPDGEHVVPLGQAAVVREGARRDDRRAGGDGAAGARGRRAAGGRPRHRRRGHRPALRSSRSTPQAILRSVDEDEPAVHGRGEPAGWRLGRRDRVARRRRGRSTASTRRSSGSRRRTSRCRRRPRSRTSPIPSVERIVETVKRRLDEREVTARRDDGRRPRHRADGRGDGPRARARRARPRPLEPHAAGPPSARRRARRAASPPSPAEVADGRDVVHLDARRRRRRSTPSTAGRTASSRAPARDGPRRLLAPCSPSTRPRATRRRSARAAPGSSTRRCRAASRSPRPAS